MCDAKETNSGVTPFTNMPPNPQVLYGWGKQEGSCPKCGLKDFGGLTLDMHIKRGHPRTPQGTYSCWICSYTFKRQGQFVKHHRLGHAGEKMACWVCGEKNWASTALIYNHIKRKHPGYRKGTAREYFAKLNNNSSSGVIISRPSETSNLQSSSYFDSLSDNTSMDSCYSENSTDLDDDGAPIFRSDINDENCEDLEEDYLVDADGAPIIESLRPLSMHQNLTEQEKDLARTTSPLNSYDCTESSFENLETEHLILGI